MNGQQEVDGLLELQQRPEDAAVSPDGAVRGVDGEHVALRRPQDCSTTAGERLNSQHFTPQIHCNTCQSIYLFIHHTLIHPSLSLSLYPSYPSIYLPASNHLSIYLALLSISLSIYLSVTQGSKVGGEAFTCCSDPDQHGRCVEGPGVGVDEHGDVATARDKTNR